MEGLFGDVVQGCRSTSGWRCSDDDAHEFRKLCDFTDFAKCGPSPSILQSVMRDSSAPSMFRQYAGLALVRLKDIQECAPSFWETLDYKTEPGFLAHCMHYFTRIGEPRKALEYFIRQHESFLPEGRDSLILRAFAAIVGCLTAIPQQSYEDLLKDLTPEGQSIVEATQKRVERRMETIKRRNGRTLDEYLRDG